MPISQANAQECASRSHDSRRESSGATIAEMQRKLREYVMSGKTEPREAAQCAVAWDKLEARKAILKGRPANTSQSIRADAPKRSRSTLEPTAGPSPVHEPEG